AGTTRSSSPANASSSTWATGTSSSANASWPITCTAAISSSAGTLAAEFIRRLPVPIGGISPVLRVVLPFVALASLTPVHVLVVVPIEIIVVVDVDVAAVPIAIPPVAAPSAPGSGPQRDSRAPCQGCSGHVARISIGIVRVFNRSSPVHHSRVVRGHINNVRVRLLNFDYLLATGNCLGLHYRLGAGFEISCALRLRAHALDC